MNILFAAGFEKIEGTARGDQVSSTVIRARTSKMALEREREREREARENERRQEKESRAKEIVRSTRKTKVSVTSV